MSAPLAGLGVLVTRPAHQAAALGEALAAAGATALAFPTLGIGPAPDPAGFAAALAAIPGAYAAVFISANAVAAAAPWIAAHGWPTGVRCLAVGPASARALRELGVTAVETPPARYDSEGLLALRTLAPAMVAGRTVVIVRGKDGRALLATALRRRGAAVLLGEGYARHPAAGADPALLQAWLAARAVHAVTLTSRACLEGLAAACPPGAWAALRALPAVVLAAALSAHVRAAGWTGPVLTAARAADGALVQALIAWRRAQVPAQAQAQAQAQQQ